jgi:hypothetical protein
VTLAAAGLTSLLPVGSAVVDTPAVLEIRLRFVASVFRDLHCLFQDESENIVNTPVWQWHPEDTHIDGMVRRSSNVS